MPRPQGEELAAAIPGFAFLRYPPSRDRPYWLTITHGLSQPMDGEAFRKGAAGGLSGWGVELAVATPAEEAWPVAQLEMLASLVLKEGRPLLPHQRITSGTLMEEAPGGHLLAMERPGYEPEVSICSGGFCIVHLVGITAGEAARAEPYEGALGSRILECVLHQGRVGCVTDRKRKSLTQYQGFEEAWQACERRIAAETQGSR